ncbi:MAG: TAT-variant-translocated molybdopterin oxidoreductase [Chitinophagaceae bacterium]|nr:TAT-variant-translocated molybdopterin oxidoreductase [Chitinophagaceae bacterium]
MDQKKYWQTLGELKQTSEFEKSVENEFAEDLPVELEDGNLLDAKSPRRDFLKYLGFSTAAAMAAASCEMPVKKSIPYLNKPENIVPGISNYFATTFVQEGEAIPVVAKVRDGRPIKIEGNEMSPFTKGATSARVQASVLNLYDTARLRYPLQFVKSSKSFKEVSSLDAFDKIVSENFANLGGLPVVLLTSTVNSITTKNVIAEFIAAHPGSKHVQYDALSCSGMLLANEATFGKRGIPSYNFDKAKVIVSVAADFLGTWLNPVEFARQYSIGRKINPEDAQMSKHIQFEGMLSMTGANADDRFIIKPSEANKVLLYLLSKISKEVATPTIKDERLKKGLDMTAAMLMEAEGNALVVSGSNDVNAQILVNTINQQLGAYGKTISWNGALQTKAGIDGEMVQLVKDMNEGKIGALLIHGVNPAYDYFDADQFAKGISKLKFSVSFNDREDETTSLCSFVIPDHHFLESWGDTEPKVGQISFIQPTIAPLFKTRAFQTSLLKWSGKNEVYGDVVKSYWLQKLGSQEKFDQALQDGVLIYETTGGETLPFNSSSTSAAFILPAEDTHANYELVLYPKISIGSGKDANNPWLQELPDPITKATWDNYIMISYDMAKKFGIILDDKYEVEVTKPVFIAKVGNKELKLPILAIPGMHPNVIAVAVGYGRSEKAGRAAANVGVNVFPFVQFNGTTFNYSVVNVECKKSEELVKVAYTQTHNQYEGRNQIVKEFNLSSFRKHPDAVLEERNELVKDYAPKTGNFAEEGTLYPSFSYPGPKWGMSIDLNSCIGCGACSVACTAENNVAVVGKSEVMRAHEMHWLRIDRYFATYRDDSGNDDLDKLNVVFMPMLCQHCDNAPCENVCPVNASNHSSEGINQMAYNRCIGTRYCANNCPYKVRRFNWADYYGADSFTDNQKEVLDDSVMMMNEELTRMVLNPDVTVRSRGVIEKCSFCIQRIQEGKLTAKKENRPIETGANGVWDVKSACQQACPTSAIMFGNVNDKKSPISVLRNVEQKDRVFYALEQIHTLSNVNYLAKVRNTNREVGVAEAEVLHEEAGHIPTGHPVE